MSTKVTHETYIDRDGKLCLANNDDGFYVQEFNTPDELIEFIQALIVAGEKR